MIKPLHVIGQAVRFWWREWIGMIFLNFMWVLLQIPIITGPPATAVLYAITQRVYEDDLWGTKDLWPQLRRLFWPAWRWAALNFLILLIFSVNFYAFWNATWTGWAIIRMSWLMLAVIWLSLNMFYWPFWLSQEDKSMRTTYENCGRFILQNPGPALFLVIFCAILLFASVLTTLPILIGMVSLLALIGTTAVRNSLELQQKKTQKNR